MEKYEIKLLTENLFRELKAKKLIWEHYKLTYKHTYAVFPPNGEKPLIVTAEVWKYFKPLWDKGIYTYSYKKAINSCENPDERWVNEYRSKSRLNELYNENPSANQKHKIYNQTVKVERKQWTRNERAEFRHTDKWLNFRNFMIESHNCTCDKCHKKFPNEQMECHHLIEDVDYDNLDPSRFLVLCKDCHDRIHNYLIGQNRKEEEEVPIKKVKKIKVVATPQKVKKVKKIISQPTVKKVKKIKKIKQ